MANFMTVRTARSKIAPNFRSMEVPAYILGWGCVRMPSRSKRVDLSMRVLVRVKSHHVRIRTCFLRGMNCFSCGALPCPRYRPCAFGCALNLRLIPMVGWCAKCIPSLCISLGEKPCATFGFTRASVVSSSQLYWECHFWSCFLRRGVVLSIAMPYVICGLHSLC